jgi:formate hydrogenlyase subunit 3/multisubunit Na+/H+ antiporter MnhD subunit
MYKRIFFGKLPEYLHNVKEANRYITVTMGVLAALTLIIGVYPNPLVTPISTYIQAMFANNPQVLPLPGHGHVSPIPINKNINPISDNQLPHNIYTEHAAGLVFNFHKPGAQN